MKAGRERETYAVHDLMSQGISLYSGIQEKLGYSLITKLSCRCSLVAQWLRTCLPMQGTRVRALVWEDPTCRGATGPVSHNY